MPNSTLPSRRRLFRRGLAVILWASLLAAGVGAQNVKLSVLSSWQPGSFAHAGISTPDPLIDSCNLAYSVGIPATTMPPVNGVPVIVDPFTFQLAPTVAQLGDNVPPVAAGAERRWRFDVTLPATLPSGLVLQLQAVLWSSATPGYLRISNGVTITPQPAATEKRYLLHWEPNPAGSGSRLRLHRVDVDAGTISVDWVPPAVAPSVGASNNSWMPGPVSLSSTENHAVVTLNESISPLPVTILYDLVARTSLSIIAAPGMVGIGPARFHPQYSDRVFQLERSTATWPQTFDFVSYDLLGVQLARRQVFSNYPSNPSLLDNWTFDATGNLVTFVSFGTPALGALQVHDFTTYLSAAPGWGSLRTINPGNLSNINSPFRIVPIRGTTRIVVQGYGNFGWGPTGVVLVDLGSGVSSAPYFGAYGYETYLAGVSEDGHMVATIQASIGSNPVRADWFDGHQPLTNNMALTPVLLPGNQTWGGSSWSWGDRLAPVHGDLLIMSAGVLSSVSGNLATLACRFSGASSGALVRTDASRCLNGANWAYEVINWAVCRYGFAGGHCPLRTRDALLVPLEPSASGNPYWGIGLIDTTTMTHVALAGNNASGEALPLTTTVPYLFIF